MRWRSALGMVMHQTMRFVPQRILRELNGSGTKGAVATVGRVQRLVILSRCRGSLQSESTTKAQPAFFELGEHSVNLYIVEFWDTSFRPSSLRCNSMAIEHR